MLSGVQKWNLEALDKTAPQPFPRFLSYPLFADGLPLGHPLPLLQDLLLDLCWGQLGLVVLEVHFKLFPGLQRGFFKRLEGTEINTINWKKQKRVERLCDNKSVCFTLNQHHRYLPLATTSLPYNVCAQDTIKNLKTIKFILLSKGLKYLFLLWTHCSPLLGDLPDDIHWFNVWRQQL